MRDYIQTIFADHTYPKPFFVTYINTSLFVLPLFTILFSRTFGLWRMNKLSQVTSFRSLLRHLDSEHSKAEEQQSILRAGSFDSGLHGTHSNEVDRIYPQSRVEDANGNLGLRATAKLSLEFCLLWVCTRPYSMKEWLANFCSLLYVIRQVDDALR